MFHVEPWGMIFATYYIVSYFFRFLFFVSGGPYGLTYGPFFVFKMA